MTKAILVALLYSEADAKQTKSVEHSQQPQSQRLTFNSQDLNFQLSTYQLSTFQPSSYDSAGYSTFINACSGFFTICRYCSTVY